MYILLNTPIHINTLNTINRSLNDSNRPTSKLDILHINKPCNLIAFSKINNTLISLTVHPYINDPM